LAPGKHDYGACDNAPEAEIARAWSPELSAKLHARFGDSVGAKLAIDHLDELATTWITDYRNACAGPRNTRTFARLGCLLGERDMVSGMTDLMSQVPGDVIDGIEMGGILPRPQACEGDSPVAPPTMPEEPQQRQQIYELRPRLIAARWTPPKLMLAQI